MRDEMRIQAQDAKNEEPLDGPLVRNFRLNSARRWWSARDFTQPYTQLLHRTPIGHRDTTHQDTAGAALLGVPRNYAYHSNIMVHASWWRENEFYYFCPDVTPHLVWFP